MYDFQKLKAALFVLLWILSAVHLCPGDIAEKRLPENIEIETQALPETTSIGSPVQIELKITAPAGYAIVIPEPGQTVGDFHILEFTPVSRTGSKGADTEETNTAAEQAAELQHFKSRFVVTVYKTGTFSFSGIPLYITDPSGKKQEYSIPPTDVTIGSVLTNGDTRIRDLKAQAEIPEQIQWWPWILAAVAACILASGAWYARRKYKNRTVAPPPGAPGARNPFEQAESDLRELIARRLPEKNRAKMFYVLLAEIVKRILESAYGIRTVEQTTIEIMQSLQSRSGLEEEKIEDIEPLLRQCDIVKFAKYIPAEEENEAASESAFRILNRAREYAGNREQDSWRPEVTRQSRQPGSNPPGSSAGTVTDYNYRE